MKDRNRRPTLKRGMAPPLQPAVRRLDIEAAYLKLFKDLIRRAKFKHGLSSEDASDVVQQAFLVALTRLGSVTNTRAWLSRVVDHLAVNFVRTAKRRAKLLSVFGPTEGIVRERDVEDSWS
jgi:DNA-directed RNA polymerase specialized sigma24 family protein